MVPALCVYVRTLVTSHYSIEHEGRQIDRRLIRGINFDVVNGVPYCEYDESLRCESKWCQKHGIAEQ